MSCGRDVEGKRKVKKKGKRKKGKDKKNNVMMW